MTTRQVVHGSTRCISPDRTDSRCMTRPTSNSRCGKVFHWQRSTVDSPQPPPRLVFLRISRHDLPRSHAPIKASPMNLPIVTVLLPVYNGERYLREAVESILA